MVQPDAEPAILDDRPVVTSKAARPISGGTLLVTSDGSYAVAADAERDRINIVNIRTGEMVQQLDLELGDEPGRVAEDPLGGLHIVLRGSGEVISFDLMGATVLRRSVCPSPRGIG